MKQILQRYKDLQDIIAILGIDELSEDDKLTVAARAQDPEVPVAAVLRRRAVHRLQGQVRADRRHGPRLQGDRRRQARRHPGAGVLPGRARSTKSIEKRAKKQRVADGAFRRTSGSNSSRPSARSSTSDVDEVEIPGRRRLLRRAAGPRAAARGAASRASCGTARAARSIYAFVAGGFAEVLPDRVSILAQVAERAEDIDVAARRGREAARRRAAARGRRRRHRLRARAHRAAARASPASRCPRHARPRALTRP